MTSLTDAKMAVSDESIRLLNNGQQTRVVSNKELSDIVGKFRRPMAPGETRHNLIYNVITE